MPLSTRSSRAKDPHSDSHYEGGRKRGKKEDEKKKNLKKKGKKIKNIKNKAREAELYEQLVVIIKGNLPRLQCQGAIEQEGNQGSLAIDQEARQHRSEATCIKNK